MARTRRNWTPAEDACLRAAVKNASAQSRPHLWRELAKSVPGRSNKDCRRRWWNSLADGPAKGPWSEEEDERLIEAVQKHGTNWSQVAAAVGSRNSDQCLSHWNHVLDPDINHRDWTTKEDELLLHAVLSHGTNWTTISGLHTPKRTTLALKNRYSALRLRNENSKKAKDASEKKPESAPGTEDSAITTTNSEQEMNQKPSDMGQWNSCRGADAEEEHENEDGWDEEDEEVHDSSNDGCEPSHVSPRTQCKEANSSAPDVQMKDLSGAASGSATNFNPSSDYGLFSPSPPHHDITQLCTEAWMSDTAYSTPCESIHSLDLPQLGLGPEYNDLGAIQAGGIINTGGDAMDFGLPFLADYNTVTKPMLGPSACASTPETEGGHASTPNTRSSISSDAQATQGNGLLTYEVAVYAECTVTDLEGLMAGLANTGTPFTVKIKPKPLNV